MSPSAFDISDLLADPDEFPFPPWDEVDRRIGALPADARPAAWAAATRQWVSAVRDRVGDGFGVFESEHVQLLAWAGDDFGDHLVRHAEYCRRSLLDLFPEIARFVEPGKHVVFAFPDPRVYYAYVSAFHPEEGEFGGSAGVHVRVGYPHIVACGTIAWNVQAVVAQELTHAALHHLDAPPWLEEGVAQLVEQLAVGRPPLEVTGELARRHKRYWGRHGLGAFWWGDGFHAPGRAQQVCYELAEVLLRLLVEEHRPGWFGKGKRDRLIGFLKEARQEDAGQASAVEHLRYSLGTLAARYLGPGDWEPRPADAGEPTSGRDPSEDDADGEAGYNGRTLNG